MCRCYIPSARQREVLNLAAAALVVGRDTGNLVRGLVGTEEDACWVVGSWDQVLAADEWLGSWSPGLRTEKAKVEGEESWKDDGEGEV